MSRVERDKLLEMAADRRSVGKEIGAATPPEFREAMLKAVEGHDATTDLLSGPRLGR